MKYYLTLAYNGHPFCGWQRQPKGASVQAYIEQVLSTILREEIEITGCGRTDTGVHARYYVAHFSTEASIPPTFVYSMNRLLPADIVIYGYQPIHDTAHARFDAYERSYEYHIALIKTPFEHHTIWQYPQARLLDKEKMQETAQLLTQFDNFYPFCKTHSGVEHYRCKLTHAHWVFQPEAHKMVFHITANRFLRGMIRLIVGTCVQVGMGSITVGDVKNALETQTTLTKALSVPPDGLYLTRVVYPYPIALT
jgi:tRNA pseudouridine38-40 synthase